MQTDFGNPDSCKQQTTSLNLIVFTLQLHLWDLAVKRYFWLLSMLQESEKYKHDINLYDSSFIKCLVLIL